MSENLSNPVAKQLNPEHFAIYRTKRLDVGILPATLNRELITLKALFRELKRLRVIDYDSLMLNVRKIREQKRELSFLTKQQIALLNKEVNLSTNESLPFVFTICLATGARWSEAESLSIENCLHNHNQNNQGFQFADTKNGDTRYVPVSETVFNFIKDRLKYGKFKPCYSAYRSAFSRSRIKVPPGQLAHILRHTFASHFVMNGGIKWTPLSRQKIH